MTERESIPAKKPIVAAEKANDGIYSYSSYWALQPNEQDVAAVEAAAVYEGRK